MAIDFDQVRLMLKDAIKASFDATRAKHPKETFYAFALYDADGTGPTPAANSEEKWRKRVKADKSEGSDRRFLSRWSTAEWAYEADECDPLAAVWALLRAERAADPAEFRVRSFGASVFALKELADEGYFGTGKDRVTVFFSISDDDDAVWLERESARRINPPEVFAAFEPEWRKAAAMQYGDDAFDGGELAQTFTRIFGSA